MQCAVACVGTGLWLIVDCQIEGSPASPGRMRGKFDSLHAAYISVYLFLLPDRAFSTRNLEVVGYNPEQRRELTPGRSNTRTLASGWFGDQVLLRC